MLFYRNSTKLKILTIFLGIIFYLNGIAQTTVPVGGCAALETFDNNNTWTFGGNNSSWIWGKPNKRDIKDDITGGGKAIMLGGNTPTSLYNSDEDSWAESPNYNLSNSSNPYLQFYFYWSNEASTNYDEIWMEYSLNNGFDWNILSAPIGSGSCYDQNWYNYSDNWGGNVGGCYSGTGAPTNWVLVRKCIKELANKPNVRFRFRISTGQVCENFGAAVDNFSICDAYLQANASYKCIGTEHEVQFKDQSIECPTGWLWDFGDGTTSDVQHPVHKYTNAGDYTVTLRASSQNNESLGCGGPFYDSFSFQVLIITAESSVVNNVSCIGASDGNISVLINGSAGLPTYSWLPQPTNGQGTDSIYNLFPGNYVVTITPTTLACSIKSTFTITQPLALSVTHSTTDESCPNSCDGAIELSVSGGTPPYNTINWSPSMLTKEYETNLCAGAYLLKSITDSKNCITHLETTITVGSIQLPVLYTLSNYTICEFELLTIAEFSSITIPSNFSWNNISEIDIGFGLSGNGNIDSFIAAGTSNDPLSISVEVVPFSSNKCIGLADTFNITVNPLHQIELGNDTILCLNEQLLLSVNTQIYKDYSWNTGQDNNTITITNSGTYSITTTTQENCTSTDSITIIYPGIFNLGNDTTICDDKYLNLIIDSDFDEISWNTGSNQSHIIVEDSGFYKVRAVKGHCVVTDSINVLTRDCSPFVDLPAVFTPNGDNINDIFAPITIKNIENYKLLIYNRWGNIMFQSEDVTLGWNGLNNENKEAVEGTYFWIIEHTNNDQLAIYNGFLTLIR